MKRKECRESVYEPIPGMARVNGIFLMEGTNKCHAKRVQSEGNESFIQMGIMVDGQWERTTNRQGDSSC